MSDESGRRPPEDFTTPEMRELWYQQALDDADDARRREVADLEARLGVLRAKIESGTAPPPKAIHPRELQRLLRHGGPLADRVHMLLKSGELAASSDMPDGTWEAAYRKSLPQIHIIELLKMPLSQYEETKRKAQAGEVVIVGDEERR